MTAEGLTPVLAKTLTDLDLGRLLSALAARCVSPAGRRLALALPLLETREHVVRSLSEIDEARRLSDRGEPLPRADLPELDATLARARIGSQLSSEEIRAVLAVLSAGQRLRKHLRAQREATPLLSLSCDVDPALDELVKELARSFDPDGGIADAASPRLSELRQEQRASRDRIVRRLSELLSKYSSLLSDSYWTERDGRYVLPIRADAHERFPGIVHGASAGGSTLFVEPRVIVPMGNRHKVLSAQVMREEELVLLRLTTLIGEQVDAIVAAEGALAHADLRAGCATLAVDLRLSTPIIPEATSAAHIELSRARHPLLLLDGVDVVPSDLTLHSGQVLVLSGPNAGGKTVALKTLGLAALMVRSGLPAPAREGSVVSLFDRVLTDVGDDQSLSKNLSTFSAHVRNLSTILDETGPDALVLLDEVASGTDPREGEALATAVLSSLADRGGAVACTTHYEALKVLALTDPRFSNASVGFDFEHMTPTFKVLSGVPGASSALSVARRFGIPNVIVERAEALLSQDTVTVSKLVERLESERRALDRAKEQAAREAAELRTQQQEVKEQLARLERRAQESLSRETEGLISGVKRAREELRAAQARLRAPKLDDAEVSGAARAIDKVAASVAIGGALEPVPPRAQTDRPGVTAAELFPGMRVFVPRLRTDAEVLEVLHSGQVRVAAGPLKLVASVEEIRKSDAPKNAKKPNKPKGSLVFLDAAADPDLPLQTSDNTVDLRGLRAHEVVPMAEQFLDRCVGSGLRVAFLIHGHGTGALRQTLREALARSSYVERHRPGEPREGGDGVTVVWLR